MTRFVYIADTHLGAAPMGYMQQPGYPGELRRILAAMVRQASADGPIDFILHGGDMVDTATEANILAAAAAYDLEIPVYLCLGNHDLTAPDALARWLALAPRFFPGGSPNYTIATADCRLHVAPNHWDDAPYFWDRLQRPHLRPEQRARLKRELRKQPELPHLLATHCPVHGLPPEQTGLEAPHHAPDPAFTASIADLAAAHPNLTCVLGAHNHMNMCVQRDGVAYVTVSSLVETPFECKRFEVTPERVTMTTLALQPALGFGDDYDPSHLYVQGRPIDREFDWAVSGR